MDFLYRPTEKIDKSTLAQGDIIEKKEGVVEALSQAHHYYADAPAYTHLMIITQSCDLVRRRGDFNAPYITVAAVKPFSSVLREQVFSSAKVLKNTEALYLTPSGEAKARELLERFMNNTDSEHFFLPSSLDHGLAVDLLVFLRLTVAMRKSHYDALAENKVLELHDVFRAKVGWLKANIYSRVATPDIVESLPDGLTRKQQFIERYMSEGPTTLTSLRADRLRAVIKGRDETLAADEVEAIIQNELPTEVRILAERLASSLINKKIVSEDQRERLTRTLQNDPTLKGLIKQA